MVSSLIIIVTSPSLMKIGIHCSCHLLNKISLQNEADMLVSGALNGVSFMLKILLILNLVFIQLAFAEVFPDGQARRELTTEEKQHLLHMGKLGQGGCSASALTPDTMITAEHCISRYPDGDTNLDIIDGYFELDPSHTFTVETVYNKKLKKKRPVILDVSSHYANDVIIVKIKWTSGAAPAQLRYTREIVINENDLKFGADHEATPLFTLGYPRDREKKATYSSGFLKDREFPTISKTLQNPYTNPPTDFEQALFLGVNVSTTNGNSGGAVFTDNYKLVGIVHGGKYVSPDDAKITPCSAQSSIWWNRVAALYHLYPSMKQLQALYPNGINPNVNENGEWIGK